MDQEKIGRFIAERRKAVNLTQMQLAEKLNITNRAVSKWETGKAMPDSAIMLELCDILQISVNDLLHGDILSSENYENKVRDQLLDVLKQKEYSEKRLMTIIVAWKAMVLLICPLAFLCMVYAPTDKWHGVMCMFMGLGIIASVIVMIGYERTVGYYQCKNCQHIYTPTYGSLFLADGFVKKEKAALPSLQTKKLAQKSLQQRITEKTRYCYSVFFIQPKVEYGRINFEFLDFWGFLA